MALPPPDKPADPVLDAWLSAREPPFADQALAKLIEETAMPVIRQTLGRKLGAGSPGSDGAQEVISRVREQLVRAARHMLEPGAAPIHDYAGYVATVAQTVWAEYLRGKYPARTLLSYRLRYLLENRSGRTGFALWGGPGAAARGGFAEWKSANTPAAAVEPLRRLLVNPRLADGPQGAAASTSLPEVVARTLRALGGPVAFHDLLAIVADRLGVNEAPEPFEAGDEATPADPAPTPADALLWKEYLAWLWREIGALPLRQRRAFLLHSTVAHDLEYRAVAGVRQQAALLEIKPETFADLWTRLPLDDLTIASLLGVTRQQVINLRKVARATLGAAWAKWREHGPKLEVCRHNRPFSPSH